MPNRERVLRTYLVFLLRLANAVGDFVSRHRRKTFFLLITATFSHNWALGSGHVFSCTLPMLLAISLEQSTSRLGMFSLARCQCCWRFLLNKFIVLNPLEVLAMLEVLKICCATLDVLEVLEVLRVLHVLHKLHVWARCMNCLC